MRSSKTALFAIAIAFVLLSLPCMGLPAAKDAQAPSQEWKADVKAMGIITPLDESTFVFMTGSTANPKRDVYGVEDGKLIASYTNKEWEAAQAELPSAPGQDWGGVHSVGNKVVRTDPADGHVIWTYAKKNAYILAGKQGDGYVVFAETQSFAAARTIKVVKLDGETGAVLWEKELGIKLELSLKSIGDTRSYHLQIDAVGSRVMVISKGLAILDLDSGALLGEQAFSVQGGVSTVDGAKGAALMGGPAAIAAAAVLSGVKLGEVWPEFLISQDKLYVYDIDGNVFALSMDDASLVWKKKFERVNSIGAVPESGQLLISTGLIMANGYGKALYEGKAALVLVSDADGSELERLDSGWVVATMDDPAGRGRWLVTESSMSLVDGMKTLESVDLKQKFGLEKVFALFPKEDGRGVILISRDFLSSYSFATGSLDFKTPTGSKFAAVTDGSIEGRYFVGVLCPSGDINFQKYAFICLDCETGQVVHSIDSGISNNKTRFAADQFTYFPAMGLFVREEGKPGKASLVAYQAWPGGR